MDDDASWQLVSAGTARSGGKNATPRGGGGSDRGPASHVSTAPASTRTHSARSATSPLTQRTVPRRRRLSTVGAVPSAGASKPTAGRTLQAPQPAAAHSTVSSAPPAPPTSPSENLLLPSSRRSGSASRRGRQPSPPASAPPSAPVSAVVSNPPSRLSQHTSASHTLHNATVRHIPQDPSAPHNDGDNRGQSDASARSDAGTSRPPLSQAGTPSWVRGYPASEQHRPSDVPTLSVSVPSNPTSTPPSRAHARPHTPNSHHLQKPRFQVPQAPPSAAFTSCALASATWQSSTPQDGSAYLGGRRPSPDLQGAGVSVGLSSFPSGAVPVDNESEATMALQSEVTLLRQQLHQHSIRSSEARREMDEMRELVTKLHSAVVSSRVSEPRAELSTLQPLEEHVHALQEHTEECHASQTQSLQHLRSQVSQHRAVVEEDFHLLRQRVDDLAASIRTGDNGFTPSAADLHTRVATLEAAAAAQQRLKDELAHVRGEVRALQKAQQVALPRMQGGRDSAPPQYEALMQTCEEQAQDMNEMRKRMDDIEAMWFTDGAGTVLGASPVQLVRELADAVKLQDGEIDALKERVDDVEATAGGGASRVSAHGERELTALRHRMERLGQHVEEVAQRLEDQQQQLRATQRGSSLSPLAVTMAAAGGQEQAEEIAELRQWAAGLVERVDDLAAQVSGCCEEAAAGREQCAQDVETLRGWVDSVGAKVGEAAQQVQEQHYLHDAVAGVQRAVDDVAQTLRVRESEGDLARARLDNLEASGDPQRWEHMAQLQGICERDVAFLRERVDALAQRLVLQSPSRPQRGDISPMRSPKRPADGAAGFGDDLAALHARLTHLERAVSAGTTQDGDVHRHLAALDHEVQSLRHSLGAVDAELAGGALQVHRDPVVSRRIEGQIAGVEGEVAALRAHLERIADGREDGGVHHETHQHTAHLLQLQDREMGLLRAKLENIEVMLDLQQEHGGRGDAAQLQHVDQQQRAQAQCIELLEQRVAAVDAAMRELQDDSATGHTAVVRRVEAVAQQVEAVQHEQREAADAAVRAVTEVQSAADEVAALRREVEGLHAAGAEVRGSVSDVARTLRCVQQRVDAVDEEAQAATARTLGSLRDGAAAASAIEPVLSRVDVLESQVATLSSEAAPRADTAAQIDSLHSTLSSFGGKLAALESQHDTKERRQSKASEQVMQSVHALADRVSRVEGTRSVPIASESTARETHEAVRFISDRLQAVEAATAQLSQVPPLSFNSAPSSHVAPAHVDDGVASRHSRTPFYVGTRGDAASGLRADSFAGDVATRFEGESMSRSEGLHDLGDLPDDGAYVQPSAPHAPADTSSAAHDERALRSMVRAPSAVGSETHTDAASSARAPMCNDKHTAPSPDTVPPDAAAAHARTLSPYQSSLELTHPVAPAASLIGRDPPTAHAGNDVAAAHSAPQSRRVSPVHDAPSSARHADPRTVQQMISPQRVLAQPPQPPTHRGAPPTGAQAKLQHHVPLMSPKRGLQAAPQAARRTRSQGGGEVDAPPAAPSQEVPPSPLCLAGREATPSAGGASYTPEVLSCVVVSEGSRRQEVDLAMPTPHPWSFPEVLTAMQEARLLASVAKTYLDANTMFCLERNGARTVVENPKARGVTVMRSDKVVLVVLAGAAQGGPAAPQPAQPGKRIAVAKMWSAFGTPVP